MAEFPGWIEDYFQGIPKHPVDYFEQPQENVTMSDKLNAVWSYNPFKVLLADFDIGAEPEEKPDGEKTKSKQKTKSKPAGAGNVNVIKSEPERRKSVSGERGERDNLVVVERVTERLGHPSYEKPRGGGGNAEPTQEKAGAAEGEQEHSEGNEAAGNGHD